MEFHKTLVNAIKHWASMELTNTANQVKAEFSKYAVANPSSATVGQTVVVTEVDENGKPTAWGSTDIPSDEHINDLIEAALGAIENGTY